MIYLDNSATTKQGPQVTKTMLHYMTEDFGNPSSYYDLGITAEKAIKKARSALLKAMGKNQGQLYFTSCGTEANNMAIFGAANARKRRGKRIVTSAVEHPAVLEACKRLEQQKFDVVYVGVDSRGKLDMAQLQEAINPETILITMMQVNNETGAIMPVDNIASLKQNALLHTDAVQAFEKIPLCEKADMISVSGHKVHGPTGAGALFVAQNAWILPLLAGGGQEDNMRSGTENVPAIAGFGKAVESMEATGTFTSKLKDYLWQGIKETIADVRSNSPEDGSPAILNVSFLGTKGEVILHTLEQDRIYISTGSACSSNKKGQSHVLKAMGLTDREIEGAIRFSFSRYNTIAELDIVLDKLAKAVSGFRKLGYHR